MYNLYPRKVFVVSNNKFNNCFLFIHYLEQLKSQYLTLYTEEFSSINIMATAYSVVNNLPHFTVCVPTKSTDLLKVRSNSVTEIDMLLMFFDKDQDSIDDMLQLKQIFKQAGKRIQVIDVSNDDYIYYSDQITYDQMAFKDVYSKYYTFVGDRELSANIVFLSQAYKNDTFLQEILNNKNRIFKTSSKEEEQIQSTLLWIYNKQFSTIKDDYVMLFNKDAMTQPTRTYKLAPNCEWNTQGERIFISTATGLIIAEGYSSVVPIGDDTYVEISPLDIYKTHVHKSFQTAKDVEYDEDQTQVIYHTSDTESYPIRYQVANFEDSSYKSGYWYINSKYVYKVKNETEKKYFIRSNSGKHS